MWDACKGDLIGLEGLAVEKEEADDEEEEHSKEASFLMLRVHIGRKGEGRRGLWL